MSAEKRKIETCDFCSTETELPFRYAAQDFELLEYNYRSVGEWRACTTCHELIEQNNWSEIGKRCLEDFLRRQPDADIRKSEHFIENLHGAFRSHRCDRQGA